MEKPACLHLLDQMCVPRIPGTNEVLGAPRIVGGGDGGVYGVAKICKGVTRSKFSRYYNYRRNLIEKNNTHRNMRITCPRTQT